MTMTRKDAIKTLRELWRETNNPWYEEVYNMAIEALQAKTDGDLISRAEPGSTTNEKSEETETREISTDKETDQRDVQRAGPEGVPDHDDGGS